MKIGDYVRTEHGRIEKIKTIEPYNQKECINGHTYTNNIVKSSPNIIDLIEVGDYVNGRLVKHIADFEGIDKPIRKVIFVDEHKLVPGETAENDDIKSIVTKEQFESMQYNLESEVN